MNSNSPDSGVVVRLRGLPTRATPADVEAFCAPNEPRSVHIQHTARRSTAEAYVIFDTKEQAEAACIKDKDIFGPKFGERYVRVCIDDATQPADLAGLGASTKLFKPRKLSQRHDVVVKVGGLPRGVPPADVLQLFFGWQADTASMVVREAAGGGGAHAEAFVAVESAEAAAAVVAARHGTTVTTSAGMFQLSVSPASKAEWEGAQQAQQSGGGGLVRLRGVPGRATAADVRAFFQGLRVKPGGVHLQPGGEGRHAKLALVEFETAADAKRALERDRQQFGGAFGDRFCLLQQLSRSEFQAELARFGEATAGGAAAAAAATVGTGGTGASSSSGGTQATGLPGSLAGLHSSSMAGLPSSSGLGLGSSGMGGLSSGMGGATSLGAFGPMGMLPHAAAAAAGFMHPALPPGMAGGMPGMMLPGGYVLPPGMPAMPGGWTAPGCNPYMPAVGMPPGMLPAASAAAGMRPPALQAGVFAAPGWPGMPPMPPAQGGTAAARYMVQDLTTGQKVFLDPRFNLSSYGALPPGLASCSAVATAGTTYGATATGPAASQSTAPAGAAANAGGAGAGAASAGREASLESKGLDDLSSDGPETAVTAGTAGTKRPGQSSGPPAGAAAGHGSSGNGYSVAVAAGGAGTAGGVSARQGAGGAQPGEASAGQTAGSRDVEAARADGEEQPPKRRTRARHHHHHNHHHHHHHYHPPSGNGGSSGGGSNDGGSDGGGDGSDGANDPAAAKRHASARAAGDDSSGAEGDGGGSSGRGSGAGAGAGACGPDAEGGCSRQAGPVQREAGPGVDSMEVDAGVPGAATPAADAATADVATSPRGHPHSPPSAAALAAEGVAVPSAKRARSQ